MYQQRKQHCPTGKPNCMIIGAMDMQWRDIPLLLYELLSTFTGKITRSCTWSMRPRCKMYPRGDLALFVWFDS